MISLIQYITPEINSMSINIPYSPHHHNIAIINSLFRIGSSKISCNCQDNRLPPPFDNAASNMCYLLVDISKKCCVNDGEHCDTGLFVLPTSDLFSYSVTAKIHQASKFIEIVICSSIPFILFSYLTLIMYFSFT